MRNSSGLTQISGREQGYILFFSFFSFFLPKDQGNVILIYSAFSRVWLQFLQFFLFFINRVTLQKFQPGSGVVLLRFQACCRVMFLKFNFFFNVQDSNHARNREVLLRSWVVNIFFFLHIYIYIFFFSFIYFFIYSNNDDNNSNEMSLQFQARYMMRIFQFQGEKFK